MGCRVDVLSMWKEEQGIVCVFECGDARIMFELI